MDSWWRRYGRAISLSAILALAAFLRFYRLGYKSLWYDEAWSITLAMKGLAQAYRELAGQIYPPFYQILLRLWVLAFGHTETAARSLSALMGWAAVAAVYWLARRIANQRVALIAALLLAVSPFHLEYSQEARGYSLLLLLTLLSFGSLLRWLEDGSYRWAAVDIGSTALSFYTHPYAFLLPLAQAWIWLMHLWERREERKRLMVSWVISTVLPAAAFAPMIPIFYREAAGVSRDFWIPKPSGDDIWSTVKIFAGQDRWSLASLGLVTVIGLSSLLAYEGRRRFRARLYLAWWWLPLLAAFAFSNLAFSVYQAKYLIFASVPLYLIAAEGMAQLRPRALRLTVLALVLAAHIQPLVEYYRRPKIEEWRGLSQFLKQRTGQSDLILIYEENEYDDLWRPLSYYGGADTARTMAIDGVSDIKKLRAKGRNIWLIITHVGQPDSVASIKKRLTLRYRLEESKDFPGITLQRYQVPRTPPMR